MAKPWRRHRVARRLLDYRRDGYPYDNSVCAACGCLFEDHITDDCKCDEFVPRDGDG